MLWPQIMLTAYANQTGIFHQLNHPESRLFVDQAL